MTEEEKKKYQEAARKYVKGSEKIKQLAAINGFIAGTEHAHPEGYKVGYRDGYDIGWNDAIEACAKIAWTYRHQTGTLSATLNDELQKLRK